jgi:phosphoglycolate phosphatase (TIGR01487 family)
VLKALLTDIDGTITDPSRRINTGAIEVIRSLADRGVKIVLASGNTSCFMDALCRMIGTDGTFIAENGGVFRAGFDGDLHFDGDQEICRQALGVLQEHYQVESKELGLLSPTYRFTDIAIARTVPFDEIRAILSTSSVQVIDTGYAIHLQAPGVNKGTALARLAPAMGLAPSDFLAVGDSVNDAQALRSAGIAITVANAHPEIKAVATFVAKKAYGDGFVEAVKKYESYFRARKRSTTI